MLLQMDFFFLILKSASRFDMMRSLSATGDTLTSLLIKESQHQAPRVLQARKSIELI